MFVMVVKRTKNNNEIEGGGGKDTNSNQIVEKQVRILLY